MKNVLRMCGHAVVSTVHDRLNAIERAVHDILEQNTELASTQTALLQSGVHLVENLGKLQQELHEAEARILGWLGQECVVKADIQSVGQSLAGVNAAVLEHAAKTDRLQAAVDELTDDAGAAVTKLQSGVQELASALGQQSGALDRQIQDAWSAAIQLGVDRMVGLGEGMQRTTAAALAVLEPAAHQTNAFLANETVRQICVETSDYVSTNPEMGLFAFLYSFLPSRVALDIGAHTGDVSEYLLKAGYDVYAFEPYPQSYRRLQERLSMCPQFHAFPFALGSAAGELPLYLVNDRSPDKRYDDPTVFNSLTRHSMPPDLPFNNNSVMVNVRTLDDLHREGIVPPDAGLVKIDTEGFDLEVIRGMHSHRYPVVAVEFWDTEIPFGGQGLLYTMDAMVAEMRARDYLWYIVIYRVWGHPHIAFFCNHDRSVPSSWGNVIFFRDREVFAEAQKWCAAVLPRTYFKPVPAARPKERNGFR